jgi:hypothetical protein
MNSRLFIFSDQPTTEFPSVVNVSTEKDIRTQFQPNYMTRGKYTDSFNECPDIGNWSFNVFWKVTHYPSPPRFEVNALPERVG